MNDIRIDHLFRHPAHTDSIARMIYTEFWQESGGMTVSDLVAHLNNTRDQERVPLCLIALYDGRLAGTVNLIDNDDRKRTELHPWLAALIVVPELRGLGIGTRLVQALLGEARRLGFSAVYFGTDGPAFYARLGAEIHEQVTDAFCIMRFRLDRR